MLKLIQLILNYLKNNLKVLLGFYKKKKWEIYIYFLFFFSLFLGEFTLLRLFIFLIILIYIIIYTRLLYYLEFFFDYNKWFFNCNNNKLEQQFIFLIKFYGIKNPILWLIFTISIKLFNLLRKLNYKLIYYKNENFLLWINIFIISFINPLNIICTKFYLLFIKWKQLGLLQILTTRMLSAILSLLIYTQILSIMVNYFGWIYTFFIIYILLYFISVITMREECIKGTPLLDFIKIYNLDQIKKERKNATLFGIYIDNLYNIIKYRNIEIDCNKLNSIYYYMDFFYLNNFKERFFLEKLIGIPSWFLRPKEFGIWKEIKNKPSYFIYILLADKLSFILNEFPCFVYVHLYMLKELNNKNLNIFLVLYKIQLLYIKLLLNYKLDIESYICIHKDNQLIWNNTNKSMYFSNSEKLSKCDFIIEDKEDDEFFDLYSNELFYEKLYYFLNIEEFQYLKNNKINLNIELFSSIVNNNKEEIQKFLDIFIVSVHNKEIEENIKKYIYDLIKEIKKDHDLNKYSKKKDKYFNLLNELEFYFYELIVINKKF